MIFHDIPCNLVGDVTPTKKGPQKVVKGYKGTIRYFQDIQIAMKPVLLKAQNPPCKVLRAGELKIHLGVKKYFPRGCCNQTCNIEQVQPTYASDDFHDVRYPRWFFPNKNWLISVGRRSYRGSKVSFFDIPMVMGVCVTNRMMWMICAMDSHGW